MAERRITERRVIPFDPNMDINGAKKIDHIIQYNVTWETP